MTFDNLIEKCDEAEAIVVTLLHDSVAQSPDRSRYSDYRFLKDALDKISSIVSDLHVRRDRQGLAEDHDINKLFE